jgi:hypothetical protein
LITDAIFKLSWSVRFVVTTADPICDTMGWVTRGDHKLNIWENIGIGTGCIWEWSIPLVHCIPYCMLSFCSSIMPLPSVLEFVKVMFLGFTVCQILFYPQCLAVCISFQKFCCPQGMILSS